MPPVLPHDFPTIDSDPALVQHKNLLNQSSITPLESHFPPISQFLTQNQFLSGFILFPTLLKIIGSINSVLKSIGEHERKRKRQMLVFYYRKVKRPTVNQPIEDNEDEPDYEAKDDEEVNDEGE